MCDDCDVDCDGLCNLCGTCCEIAVLCMNSGGSEPKRTVKRDEQQAFSNVLSPTSDGAPSGGEQGSDDVITTQPGAGEQPPTDVPAVPPPSYSEAVNAQ